MGSSRNRGGSGCSCRCQHRQVVHARLCEILLRNSTQALRIQADLRHPVEHGDSRRSDVGIAQDLLELLRRLVVARADIIDMPISVAPPTR